MNLFKHVRVLEVLVFEERGKREYLENQQQTQPTYGVDAGI